MHSPWASTDEIAGYFRTQASGRETAALRSELHQQLQDSHPDRTGGEFQSENQSLRFYELQDALHFLDKIASEPTALVARNDVNALLTTLIDETRSLATRKVSKDNRSERQYLESHIRSGLRRQTLIPKFTSAIFWSVSTTVFAFMGLLKNHPILGALSSNVYAKVVLVSVWLVSGAFYLVWWWREQLIETRIDYLMSEECLVEAFDSLCTRAAWSDDVNSATFTIKDFADCLDEESAYGLSWFKQLLRGKRNIDPSAAIEVARAHMNALVERKAVSPITKPSASPTFQIHPEILAPQKEKYEDYKRRLKEKADKAKAEKQETEKHSDKKEEN